MKLFAVYLGGRAERCNTELHDTVFVAGETLEATYPSIRRKWFGDQKRLHIDAYVELAQVDGFDVLLVPVSDTTPPTGELKLYFINLGAYREGYFGELHDVGFYVAESTPAARSRAKKQLLVGMKQVHSDDELDVAAAAFDIDDVVELREVDSYRVILTRAASLQELAPVSAYLKLPATP